MFLTFNRKLFLMFKNTNKKLAKKRNETPFCLSIASGLTDERLSKGFTYDINVVLKTIDSQHKFVILIIKIICYLVFLR